MRRCKRPQEPVANSREWSVVECQLTSRGGQANVSGAEGAQALTSHEDLLPLGSTR